MALWLKVSEDKMDCNKMENLMTAKMEERFRNEQQARQLAQREIMNGLRNEVDARQMVRNDTVTMKEEIGHIELGSGCGSTVGNDASTAVGKGPSGTFARPPPGFGNLLNDFFTPRKMEFKGWVTDYKQNVVTRSSRRPRCRIFIKDFAPDGT